MKVATFNINNINRRLPNLVQWLRTARPDVVALQELKSTDADFPAAAIEKAGYGAVWRGQKTWNGVAILARKAEPVLVHGRYTLLMKNDPQIYAYTRTLDGHRIVVITNLTGRPAHYRHAGLSLHHANLLLANHAVERHPETDHLNLQPYEARVYRAG